MKFKVGDLVVLKAKGSRLKGNVLDFYISVLNIPCYEILWQGCSAAYPYEERVLELVQPKGHKLTKIFQ